MSCARVAKSVCALFAFVAWLGLLLLCLADVAVLPDFAKNVGEFLPIGTTGSSRSTKPSSAAAARREASEIPNGICDVVRGVQCWGDDLKDIGVVDTARQCCEACGNFTGCNAWTWNAELVGDVSTKHCYLKSGCSDRRAGDLRYQSGFAPKPAPVPGGNPLNIQPNPKRSDNYFLIIGDWGKTGGPGGCQQKVAQMMKDYVARQSAQGKKCLFVGAVGDNFYDVGLGSNEQWFSQWANVYGVSDPASPLFNVPWLAVMGNHDLGNADPGCACGQGCNQFNGGHRPEGSKLFWMKDYNWFYYVPGVDVEIIGLDTNSLDVNGLGGNGAAGGASASFARCGGAAGIQSFLTKKTQEGESMMDERARKTTAKTAVILQHYDGPVGLQYKTRFEGENGNRAQVLSAYGHRHDQVCEGRRDRGCDVILTGGGGGWQGGNYFGFTAVHLTDDGAFFTVLEDDRVRMHQNVCDFTLAANASNVSDAGLEVKF